ncbi:tRNA (adenosine(37)-N6)-threonylcarbamoyltransferase complex dimerization subunit type 1 TsaB [Paraoerskovia sediminicola]|uniref:tRNA (Adenosine(37)-N6)-threonylcarbamoyltransferase complex dimerization subunit type 1 TsaB n=1 Tax=Paraoerskovia sediminicola TaxID=1138587 RepID=A0ABN6X927_9CELL|nr:tRNA (adenosine(37)-N6)-threonylcarbamoyltransferase complex dimerization subunit type 1 TsaB [Paraoerskovia sediminicola]BDZ41154.1 tRNA (adenosine(37)-N6)-threonylcarbamoyltransferase complex dimerization subunit type 1 TsaB [Paraoerskovia sediminicola]
MILSIDTSAAVAAALLDDDGAALAAASVPEQRRHAELLAPMISGLLDEVGARPTDVTTVVAGTGPAPFTGLRVGLVTARTFGLARGVPVLGVASLDAIAADAVPALGLGVGDRVLATSDARRKQVYWARYSVTATASTGATAGVARLERTDGYDVGPATDLAGPGGLAEGAAVVGQGTVLYPDALGASDGAPLVPDPVTLARLALDRRAAGEELGTEPLYLRRPDVQVPAPRKRAVAPAEASR